MFLEFLILIALWVVPLILSTVAFRRTSRMLASDRSYQEWLKAEQTKQLPSTSLVHSCGGIWGTWKVVTPFDIYQKTVQQRQCSDCHYTEKVEL